ncbi:MAG: hypothetical protein KatS3mg068_0292 [Candidatus Sericytochromatia bacterium]|nr:MAG: hypothetical protein KatS3mg068_0292 [Candidatus Sericytochromatia bacterium]
MSDNKKNTSNLSSGLSGSEDSFIISKRDTTPVKKATKVDINQKKEEPKVVAPPPTPKPQAKLPEDKPKAPEPPKIVLPKIIKKDSELEKEIIKVIQEVPKEELERILNPSKETKENFIKMDFQSRGDMSEQEKRDFVEEISKREPEPEVAQVNGALVWKWQKERKEKGKKV